MMPYYPVAMGYPDYAMYQPYQYYAMSANQYQSPLPYMGMNQINNGYNPNRKKHGKNHYNNYNYNSYQNNNNGYHYGQPQPAYSKTSSPASSALALNIPATPDLRLETDGKSEAALSLLPSVQLEKELTPKPSPIPAEVSDSKVSQPAGLSLNDYNSAEFACSTVPLLFNIDMDEFLGTEKSLRVLRNRIQASKDALFEAAKDLSAENTSTKCNVIDYETGSTQEVEENRRFFIYSDSAQLASINYDSNDSQTKAPLNWASLLQASGKKMKKPKANAASSPSPSVLSRPAELPTLPIFQDGPMPLGRLVMKFLYDPTFSLANCASFAVKPRGLTNSGNICYMNSVLQCLIFCDPFNKLLRLVEEKSIGNLGTSSPTPLIDATIKFVNDFITITPGSKSNGTSTNSEGIVIGRPLSPESLYMKLIESPKFQHLKWGQQEDAEEFLVYLLDGLHEEFVKAEKTVSPGELDQLAAIYCEAADPSLLADLKARMKVASRLIKTSKSSAGEESDLTDEEDSDSGWAEVGNRRKVSKKRIADIEPSPITSLFGGRFRSVLTIPNSRESQSITVDPFRCISLDISQSDVETIEDALWKLNEVEKLPYKLEDGREVLAKKQTFIDELPEIMILQLKRFSFQHDGPTSTEVEPQAPLDSISRGVGTIEKVLKNIKYELELTVPVESLSSSARSAPNRDYFLTAVIYHHGRNAEGGHYTCDVLRESNKWLRIDDNAVETIDSIAVTDTPETRDKSAYILIYQKR